AFARTVAGAGLVFIGPPPDAIATMGDKIAARRVAIAAGLPTVPGTPDPVTGVDAAVVAAAGIGYPIAVKASGGGGGRGFRVAPTEGDLAAAFEGASGEAARYFGNPEVYLERYIERPRHIEIQVMADAHGQVVALGERDCSIQRRHQKLIEETPSTAVDAPLRARLFEASVSLARAVDYVGAGTIEYLLDCDGNFHFLEMNTRIQVEHTVTEMVTGIDLVREQILVARGEPLSFGQDEIHPRGWAIECRINAEDPARDFAPTPGTLTRYREPVGFGVRVDGALEQGDAILPRYDSMIAKLVTWGNDRAEATGRMSRALEDFQVDGVATTVGFHRNVMRHPAFRKGEVSTSFLADYPEVIPRVHNRAAAALPADDATDQIQSLIVEVNGRRFEAIVRGMPAVPAQVSRKARARGGRKASRGSAGTASQDDLVSPIHGTVIRLSVHEGEAVAAGQVICVVEAMKMENELVAHKSGTVRALPISVGSTVSIGQPVVTIVDA
ncbi:MAG TPA: biotin/lipoyl-containing protein, partial [Thermomicrobiales bacterium]|nr:biotin/lipoyl-containing protein [Thermomicrobiales bacterium]